MIKNTKFSGYILMLAIILLVGVIAGCSNNESDNSSDENSTPKVTVFKSHLGTGTLPESGDAHIEYIKEATGVEYELETVCIWQYKST